MKKGYTIIELIIVILIVGVLMLAFRNVFQINNKDNLFGEACINNIYGDVSNFLYSAITSKAIYSGTTPIYPDEYHIDFLPSLNSIMFNYKSDGILSTKNSLHLSGDIPQNYHCNGASYTIILSGSDIQLTINKGLSENNTLQSMTLSGGGNMFTETIKFLLSYPGHTGYKELGKFDIDIKTQNIKKTLCLDLNINGACNQRNQ